MSTVPASHADAIVPFWNRLPRIMGYPAHLGPMVVIVALALGRLLVFFPLVGPLMALLCTLMMYRYAFDCLLATADGQLTPPDIGASDSSSLGWRFVGLIFSLIVLLLLCAVVLGKGLGLVLALVAAFALPSAIIILALEHSVFRALNPAKWFAIITRIGWPYLAVFGLCLVILFSQGYASAFVARVMPKSLAILLMAVFSNYALVATFHLLGYLVYQYHEELGFDPVGAAAFEPLAAPDPDQDVLDVAAQQVRDGHPEQAAVELGRHLRGRGGTDKVHLQYRKLLRLNDDRQGLLEHGREYLDILLARNNDRAALDLLRECRTLDSGFSPETAATVTRLARLAASSGQSELALQLLSGFHKRFPDSPDIAANYLLAATLLHERMNQDEQARRILLGLQANYPDSPLMPEIKERLALVEKMLEASRRLDAKSRGSTGPIAPST